MTASEPLGTAAQEAARLVESLSGWWREGGHADDQQADDQRAEGGASVDGDASAGRASSARCRYCPWCRAVSATQHVRPEVLQHLVAAAESFAEALRELSRPTADGAAHDDPRCPASGHDDRRPPGPRTVTISVEPDDRDADHRGDALGADEEDH